MLTKLNSDSDDEICINIINSIKSLNYHSNCENVTRYYLPIIAHVLFYKPSYSNEILEFIICPLYSLGYSSPKEIALSIKSISMNELSLNEEYLSPEGKKWVFDIFDKLENEISNTLNKCINDAEN